MLFQRTAVQLPETMLGISQVPLTPASGDPMNLLASADTHTYMYAHTDRHTNIHILTNRSLKKIHNIVRATLLLEKSGEFPSLVGSRNVKHPF